MLLESDELRLHGVIEKKTSTWKADCCSLQQSLYYCHQPASKRREEVTSGPRVSHRERGHMMQQPSPEPTVSGVRQSVVDGSIGSAQFQGGHLRGVSQHSDQIWSRPAFCSRVMVLNDDCRT